MYDRGKLEALLGELASGSKEWEEIPEEDAQLLARVTMEYATAPRTPELAKGRSDLMRATKKVVEKLVEGPAMPLPGEDVPDADMPPFWWLQ